MDSQSQYQKRQEGGATVFEVTPATSPKKRIFGTVMGLLIIGVGLLLFTSGNLPLTVFGFVLICGGGLVIWLGWSLDRRPKAHKSKATFRVTPSAIETGGRVFKKEDIHRLIVRNGMTDKLPGSHVMVSKNLAGAATQAAVVAGAAHLEKVSKVANSLDLETGGKAYTLAGGMDETTAFGLLQDVSNVIGFKV